MMRRILTILLVLTAASSVAQNLFPDYRFKVVENGDTLLFPFAGGMNSPVFAQIDLDGNGVLDLFAYEKTTGRVLTFINDGSAAKAFKFAPQFAGVIPELNEWVRSYDYDCDGDLDLFTYNVSYIFNALGEGATRVYRNDYSVGTGLTFTNITNELITTYGAVTKVVPTSPVNLPAFVDVDGDGDMDILTFSLSANSIEYHKNYSMDSTGVCSGFIFHAEQDCWGHFKLSGVSNIALLNEPCQIFAENTQLHSGSVLTAIDQGCDGDIDVINGDILGSNLLYLENGGSATSALITSQDSLFPSYDVSVDYNNLPGAYYIDGDNDGMKDLLISGFGLAGEDYNNVLFYKNTTDNCSNVFQLQQNRFIVEDMVDVGTSSVPVFFDVDGDGLMDLIIGNDFYYSIITNQKVAHLSYYRNTGTASTPEFTLQTNDFANVSSLGILGAYPAFGDLDDDGDDDMLLGTVNGDLIYYQNIGGSPANFVFNTPSYQGIDIGANSMPQIIDVDKDGIDDLLIGERTGVLNYYRNTGTAAAPVFTLQSSNFGGVNVLKAGAIQGNSCPVLFNNNGSYELVVGSESGYIYYYTNIDGNLGGTFTLVDSTWQDIYEPRRASISMFDIDNDTMMDLIVGNFAGGIKLYSHNQVSSVAEHISTNEIVYPNPVSDVLHLKALITGEEQQYSVYETSGRIILSGTTKGSIDVANLKSGFYILKLTSEKNTYSVKIIRK